MRNSDKLLYITIATCCVAINLFVFSTWNPTYVMNDAVQYLSTASNILDGNGLKTNALMYLPHFQGVLPAPQTVWPPGYPAAIALAGMIGQDLTGSTLVLNLFMHLIAAVLVVLILRRMNVATRFAVICACLFYLMAIPWWFTLGLMTEPVLIVLVLSATLALPVPGRSSFAMWLLCGLLVAACIYVRFSAVFYVIAIGGGMLIYSLVFRGRRFLISDLFRLTALLCIPLLGFCHLMIRTYEQTGTFSRNTGTRAADSLSTAIGNWGAQASDLLGLSVGAILSNKPALVLFFALIVLVMGIIASAFVVFRQSIFKKSDNNVLSYARVTGFVVLSHAIVLFGYLTYTTVTDSPTQIVTRYLYQVYPGLFVLFCAITHSLVRAVKNPQDGKIPGLLTASLVTLIAIYLVAQLNEVSGPPRMYAEGKTSSKALSIQVTENQSLGEFIETCFGDSESTASIWSTHGQHLHYHTGVPTLTLAEVYTGQAIDLTNLQTQIQQYNIRLFVFQENRHNENTDYVSTMDTIKKWLVESGHSVLSMQDNHIDENTTVEVFRVNDQCS